MDDAEGFAAGSGPTILAAAGTSTIGSGPVGDGAPSVGVVVGLEFGLELALALGDSVAGGVVGGGGGGGWTTGGGTGAGCGVGGGGGGGTGVGACVGFVMTTAPGWTAVKVTDFTPPPAPLVAPNL